jgi:hypothetical protein
MSNFRISYAEQDILRAIHRITAPMENGRLIDLAGALG